MRLFANQINSALINSLAVPGLLHRSAAGVCSVGSNIGSNLGFPFIRIRDYPEPVEWGPITTLFSAASFEPSVSLEWEPIARDGTEGCRCSLNK